MTIASVAKLINLILENWLISVFALAVFASLCLGIFKGFKHGVRAMFLVLVFASLTVSGFLVYYFVNKDVQGLIRFGIACGDPRSPFLPVTEEEARPVAEKINKYVAELNK